MATDYYTKAYPVFERKPKPAEEVDGKDSLTQPSKTSQVPVIAFHCISAHLAIIRTNELKI